MFIAVLEWNSDKGDSPLVAVADSEAAVLRAALTRIIPFLPVPAEQPVPADAFDQDGDGEINDVDRDWAQEFPVPDLDDPAAVTAWLDAFKEQTTDLWLNVYGPEDYTDARAHAPMCTGIHAPGEACSR